MVEPRRSKQPLSEQIELIAADEQLIKDIAVLPPNYSFEIPKTIWKIKTTNAKTVALQFPEGLLIFGNVIADILEKFTGAQIIMLGDVTYGACCVDDYTAKTLGCDLLVHYGHSCLVPISNTSGINMLYVFVHIDINLTSAIEAIMANLSNFEKIALVSTIQFIPSLQSLKAILSERGLHVELPQCRPLSPGEVLGCTSPKLDKDVDAILYLGDGRFHLESIMMHNPGILSFQYDPYSRRLTKETFDFDRMKNKRNEAAQIAQRCTTFGVIQGTLGRQGNIEIVKTLEEKLKAKGKRVIRILLSEIFPSKLAMFKKIDCFVQVACPRLSIDWGEFFEVPLLTPYELFVALDEAKPIIDHYPMTYYSNAVEGPYGNFFGKARPARPRRREPIQISS